MQWILLCFRLKLCSFFIDTKMQIFALFASPSTIMAETCDRYKMPMPYYGRYCTGEGIINPFLFPHHCTQTCLQSASCKAYNYNTTAKICTRFTSPCPQAFADHAMEFVVLTPMPHEQCYEWIAYGSGDRLDERMISTDQPHRIIYRMKINGDDIVCYLHTMQNTCYAISGYRQISNGNGPYPCQRLRVVEGCYHFLGSLHCRRPATQGCRGGVHGKRW